MASFASQDRAALRTPTASCHAVVPRQHTLVSATAEGRPMGAAFGRPFRRPGLVEGCAHTQCWEPESLHLPETGLGNDAAGDGALVLRLRPEAAEALRRYQSKSIPADRWADVRPFVQNAVALIAPACHYLAERLMVVVAQYVYWVVHVNGMPMVANVFHPVLVRRYIARDDVSWKDKTRRDYRSFLLRISEVAVPTQGPLEFAPLNGQSITAPYTDRELQLLESWARGQSTPYRRRGAGAVLALGSGAGLDPWEMQHLRRRDVHVDRDGIIVSVSGATPRHVPVLERWESLLRDAITELPDDAWLVGSASRTTTFNIITPFINKTDLGNEPKPVPSRMRATWLTTHLAAGTNPGTLMRVAGLRKPQHLLTSLVHIPTLDTPEHRRRILAEARHGR